MGKVRHAGGFRFGQDRSKFPERLSAWKCSDEQAVWLQRAPGLDQLRNGIVSPMQRHGMNHQIVCACLQIKNFGVRHKPRAGQGALPDLRPARHHRGRAERPVDQGKPLTDFGNRLLLKKQSRTAGQSCSPPVADQGGAVCQSR